MFHFIGRHFGRVVHGAVYEWHEDKAPRMAAAVAFYAVFSLTPIVVVAYKAAEIAFGTNVALREILGQAAFLVGQQGADGAVHVTEHDRVQEGIPRTDEIERAARPECHDVPRFSRLGTATRGRINPFRFWATALSISLFVAICFFRPGRQQ